jgi:hypothetical protein
MGAPEMLKAVGKVLGPVYNLWRGQYQSATKISPKLLQCCRPETSGLHLMQYFILTKISENSHNKTNKHNKVNIFYITRNKFHNTNILCTNFNVLIIYLCFSICFIDVQ